VNGGHQAQLEGRAARLGGALAQQRPGRAAVLDVVGERSEQPLVERRAALDGGLRLPPEAPRQPLARLVGGGRGARQRTRA
jgi:hypothetical protein